MNSKKRRKEVSKRQPGPPPPPHGRTQGGGVKRPLNTQGGKRGKEKKIQKQWFPPHETLEEGFFQKNGETLVSTSHTQRGLQNPPLGARDKCVLSLSRKRDPVEKNTKKTVWLPGRGKR